MTVAAFPPVLPANTPPLTGRDVHIWRINLGGKAWPNAEEILDATERERAARFVFPRDRNRYLRAHRAMRNLLSAYLALPPAEVSIISGPHGKPQLAARQLGFNLSHSADCGMFAVSTVAEIGVDVEMHRLPQNARQLAESVFSSEERKTLAQVPDTGLSSAFFTCWTRKEACLKATGVGLTIEPATVTVGMNHNRQEIKIPGPGMPFTVEVASIEKYCDCSLAIAAIGGYSNLSLFEYDDECWKRSSCPNQTS